ncbi:unnamed protein product [Brachionus calyciflorus]|uniref:Uncharacterized protein n=1 Tax=Brachionus calyciflorus TaxID=104777 RepID=A0A813MKC0_9BILA|nr:unnamed protein product [Brachionus calyciflorus]
MVRFKRRYFCCELIFRDSDLNSMQTRTQMNKLKHTDLSSAIHKSIEKFYGDLGAAEMIPSFSVIYYNLNTNLCILRTARNLEKKFHTLLTFIQKIEEYDVKFKIIHKSGSIRKCKEFMLEYCTQRLFEFYRKMAVNPKEMEVGDDGKSVIKVLENIIEACEQNDYNFN